MISDLERRLERLEKSLTEAEKTQDQQRFLLYLRRKIQGFADSLSIKEWLVVIVSLYVAVSIGVLISKGLN